MIKQWNTALLKSSFILFPAYFVTFFPEKRKLDRLS